MYSLKTPQRHLLFPLRPRPSHAQKHIPLYCMLTPFRESSWVPRVISSCLFLPCNIMCVSHSVVSDSFVTPWTVEHQTPLSMEFSRQEYWSGLPFPSPGDLPDPGIEPRSPALQADSLPTEPPGKNCILFFLDLHPILASQMLSSLLSVFSFLLHGDHNGSLG